MMLLMDLLQYRLYFLFKFTSFLLLPDSKAEEGLCSFAEVRLDDIDSREASASGPSLQIEQYKRFRSFASLEQSRIEVGGEYRDARVPQIIESVASLDCALRRKVFVTGPSVLLSRLDTVLPPFGGLAV
jgi:hypothetical protein